MLVVTSDWASTRDLRHYADTTSLGRARHAIRTRRCSGADVGVERDRTFANSVGLSPRLASWLRSEASVQSNFVLSRSLTSRNPVRIDGDTAGAYILPQTLNNSRTIEMQVALDPSIALRRLFGDSSAVAPIRGADAPGAVHPPALAASRRTTWPRFTPGWSYLLALGSLDRFLAQDGQPAIGVVNARGQHGDDVVRPPGRRVGLAFLLDHRQRPLPAERRAASC